MFYCLFIFHNRITFLSLLKMKENISKWDLEVLKKLIIFEVNHVFTEKGMTILKAATHMSTNVKYLQKVVLKYRHQNFATYLRTQRIQYVTHLLLNDIKSRTYKISYLADIAGFSSHSQFAKAFKEVLGITPSLYIDKLNRTCVSK